MSLIYCTGGLPALCGEHIMEIINELSEKGLLAGIVTAQGVDVRETPTQLKERMVQLVEERRQSQFPPPELKQAVRDLLRKGGFKPSGRNKPASEYLVQAAQENVFPFINNLVDVNNYLSLRCFLPVSLLDAAEIGGKLLLRFGRSGEKYVFNKGGQEISLEGLICACAGADDAPLGTPIKDSMQGKLKEHTRSVAGIIYAPGWFYKREALEQDLLLFAELLKLFGGAQSLQTQIV